ncbi:MAG: hypothetical protein IPK19_05925 [Chloroflexi bacterium]|nr:hypothetical protein [Chloroflexota bacterium]
MRTLLLELRPDKLPHINMPTQLQQLTDALKARKHINIRLETRDTQLTPIEVRIALYRIAQEALNNVAKHAEATELLVQWEASATQARLVVQDNGNGFRIDEQAGANNFGLQSMKERAQQIQADFHVRSAHGRGTTIRVKWKALGQER